jgi:hypothetical protein
MSPSRKGMAVPNWTSIPLLLALAAMAPPRRGDPLVRHAKGTPIREKQEEDQGQQRTCENLGSIEIYIISYYLIIYHKRDGVRDEAKPALTPTLLYTTIILVLYNTIKLLLYIILVN